MYSAVPTGVTLDEITQLVRAVEETGRIYMIGETSYYYPAPVYCRKRLADGAFGHIVYGEAEYPPNNVWQAARFAIPGIIAHESCQRGGALLEVPDLGDPPA